MIRCFRCKVGQLIPIVYDLQEDFVALAGLGKVWLGSKLSGHPLPLWYCTSCQTEFTDREPSTEADYTESTTSSYNATVAELRSLLSTISEDQVVQGRGSRWLDMLAKALVLCPTEIRIQRIDSEATVHVILRDETIPFPSWPIHMFDDLIHFLSRQESVQQGLSSRSFTLRTAREQVLNVVIDYSPQQHVREIRIRPI